MKNKSLEFLRQLVDTQSPSGFEGCVAQIWLDHVQPHLRKDVKSDHYGNLTAIVKPKGSGTHRIMLCAHIDEIGFMVSYVSDEGFLYLSQLGGIDCSILPGQRVRIMSRKGTIHGVFGRKPIHLMGDDEDSPEMHNLFVDIGAASKKAALKLVSIGDPVTLDASFCALSNDCFVARGFDDRLGAWCVAEAMIRLQKSRKLKSTVFGVCSVQEEAGFFAGARMRAEDIHPTVALAIDVAHATDFPGMSKERCGDVKLGDGPIVTFGTVAHSMVSGTLVKVAKSHDISFQKAVEPNYTGTDADAIFVSGTGVPTGVVSIPTRYVHTPVEMVQREDLENTVDLLVAWCEKVDDKDFRTPKRKKCWKSRK